MTRQVHHGHYRLPLAPLGWDAQQWQTAYRAMYYASLSTLHLIRDEPSLKPALQRTADEQSRIAQLLKEVQPEELRADDIRMLVAALRRAGELDMAAQLCELFNTQPGRVAP